MSGTRKKVDSNPVNRTVFLKERLIKRLRNEISNIHQRAAEEVKRIEFRIKMAQTLVDALKK